MSAFKGAPPAAAAGAGAGAGACAPGHEPAAAAAAPCRLADVPGVARGVAKLSPAGVVLLSRLCGCIGSADLARARQVVLDFRGWACDPAAAQANKWASQTRATRQKRLMRYMRPELVEPLVVLGLDASGTKQVLVDRLLDFAEDPVLMLGSARSFSPPDPRRQVGAPSGSAAAATAGGGAGLAPATAASWAPGRGLRGLPPPLRPLSAGAPAAAAVASPYGMSTAYAPSRGGGGPAGLGRPPGSGTAASSLPPLRRPGSVAAAGAARRHKSKPKRARLSYVEDPYLSGESPFHVPMDRPLGEPVLLVGAEFGKLSPQLPSHLFATPLAADMTSPGGASGEVQVHLRCLRVDHSRPSSSWKQEWPFPVTARINGRFVDVPQARRHPNGKSSGPDMGMDITPYLALPRQPRPIGSASILDPPAVAPENRVSLLPNCAGHLTDPPPGTYVLFAQIVRVATDAFFVQLVEAQTAGHIERLRERYGVPATRPDGSATTSLDVAVADVAAFMSGDDIEIESAKVSLRCPLSTGRLTVPVKGIDCKHLQCFDLAMFLAYARRSRQFACPVCNRQTASLERLWISPLLTEALRLCPSEDDVEVLSDGSLRPPAASAAAAAAAEAAKAKASRVRTYGLDDSDDDDDDRMRSSPAGVQAAKSSSATSQPDTAPIQWNDAMDFLASGGEGAGGGAAGDGTSMTDADLPSGLCTPPVGFLPSVISTPPAAVSSPPPPPAAAPRPTPGVAFVDLTGDSDDEEAAPAAPLLTGTPVSEPPSSSYLWHSLPSPPAPPQGGGSLFGSGLHQLMGQYPPSGGDGVASGGGLRRLTADGSMHDTGGGGGAGTSIGSGNISGGLRLPPLPPLSAAAAAVGSGAGGVTPLPPLLPGSASVSSGVGGVPQPVRPPEEPGFSLGGGVPLLSAFLPLQPQSRGGVYPPPRPSSSPGLELPIGASGLPGTVPGPEGLAAARP